jgi:hypothetical protein
MCASIYRKRHKLYQEGIAKIKLPSFNPMVVNGTVYEKTHGEFEVVLNLYKNTKNKLLEILKQQDFVGIF